MRPGSETQRNRILRAAADVFAARGLAGARVDEIAAAAGVNKRLLYHYVGAKEQLFEAVLEREAGLLDDTSLVSGRLWALVVAEALESSSNRLIRSVISCEQRLADTDPGSSGQRLARKMFSALLPEVGPLLQTAQEAPKSPEKPRVRLMPKVVAAQDPLRNDSKRSK